MYFISIFHGVDKTGERKQSFVNEESGRIYMIPLNRLIRTLTLAAVLLILITAIGCDSGQKFTFTTAKISIDAVSVDYDRIVKAADQFLLQDPVPLTFFQCDRSQGGLHDFYSEGDYWWPDPDNPEGPYVRRDGQTNPENFTAHRQVMRRMSIQVAALTAAFKVTGETRYAAHAVRHLKVWFIQEETRMNPHMKYAQAIKGRVPGRGVGLIDGIHLVEPARAISCLVEQNQLDRSEFEVIQSWFVDFIRFMTEHEYGIDERERKNNHGTCWVMQLAEFARLTEDKQKLEYCRNRYKMVLLPNQMSQDGSFHMEMARTKPYGYSLFNIDAMSMICLICSTPGDNLWTYALEDGRCFEAGLSFISPFIQDKSLWPLEPDIMYWDEWPLSHPSLLFGGMALEKQDYVDLWMSLPPDPATEEGWRNFPIRQPILWLDRK